MIHIYILESSAALRAASILVGGATPPPPKWTFGPDLGARLEDDFQIRGAALYSNSCCVVFVATLASTLSLGLFGFSMTYAPTSVLQHVVSGSSPPRLFADLYLGLASSLWSALVWHCF